MAELKPDGATPLTAAPEAFQARARAAMATAREKIAALKAMPDSAPALDRLSLYDQAGAVLGDASALASVARNAHPDPAMRAAAEQCEQELDALGSEFGLDPGIFHALEKLDLASEAEQTRYYLFRTLRDFRRAGVDRDEPTRKRIQALNEELTKVGQEFSRNIRDDVRRVAVESDDLKGLPEDYIRGHAPDADGKIWISTDTPDYIPFVSYSQSSKAREQLWRAYRQRAHPKNLEVLTKLLTLRHELAGLLGHPTWASFVTADKMIGSDQAARDFIEKIATASKHRAGVDHARLVEENHGASVNPWDAEVLKEAVRRKGFSFDAQSVRPYFEFNQTLAGLLALTARLFGVEYKQVQAGHAPVWSPEVSCYDVYENGALIGRFYLDLHPREGKYKHAAQFTVASGQKGAKLPEAALICNFPGPSKEGGEPALLEHGEVVTMFHEFGHLLHHIFGGNTRWSGLSGVRTEWDFVEAPSQLLEEWCWDVGVLQTFAKHVETHEPIPAALVERMRAADEFGKGLRVRQQMFYAAVSLSFHDRDPAGLDTTALAAELQERYTPFKHIPGTYFHESFGHLEGYSAIYYTYMWSLVIAKDLFTVFHDAGLLNTKTMQRYRDAILAQGGAKKAAQLVRDFMGRDSDFGAYAKWLEA